MSKVTRVRVRRAMRETAMELLEYAHPKPISADKICAYMASLPPLAEDYAGRDNRAKTACSEVTRMQERGLIRVSGGFVHLGHAAGLV